MASCQVNLPHNLDLILDNADDQSLKDKARDKLIDELHAGVFLNNKKQKFFVDMITSANSFELYATDLLIAWGQDTRYWKWTSMKDTIGVQMEMAELVEVCWLDVKTNFPTQMLTPGTSYEVSFVLKTKGGAEGFAKSPVTLKLDLPNQKPVERTEDLSYMQGEKWKEIRVGEFVTSCNMSGNMKILMYHHDDFTIKKGLVVNKIIIRPTTRKVFSGKNYWGGLLEDPHVDLRKYITFYGERVDAIYDSINDDKTDPSRFGFPKYEETKLFSEVGLDKDNKSKIYEVKKYIYAKIDVPFPVELVSQDRSTWIGYVAVATDYGVKVLGRRDILVCWRGTSSDAEWIRIFSSSNLCEDIFPSSVIPRCTRDFTPSTQRQNRLPKKQVLEIRFSRKLENGEMNTKTRNSITVTGHSLGAALATMNAVDMVSMDNMPISNPTRNSWSQHSRLRAPRLETLLPN
ncbi:uncharacterized protein LOC116109523 [Pistacia vera]|uniref:uncharacterized protein LOC116109523 n=1 Tax=Pistacia vera TaxID=55513 RepID=UPI0012632884|nr:uncharacterized protein LOC116109523 [Pistacia vera]